MNQRKLYLARHGETIFGTEMRYIGRTDVELSEKGKQQAQQLADDLKDVKLAAVYSSPLKRCIQTARIATAGQGIEPIIVDELAEIDLGDWEGLTQEEIREKWPEIFAARRQDMAEFAAPGGEAWGSVQKRAVSAIEKILQTAPEGPVFIAGHRGINGTFLCHLMELPLDYLFNLGQDYGCLNVVNFFEGKARLELVNWTGDDPFENATIDEPGED